jgi:hypothetical protein
MTILNFLLTIPMPYRNLVVALAVLFGAWVLYRIVMIGMDLVERLFRL